MFRRDMNSYAAMLKAFKAPLFQAGQQSAYEEVRAWAQAHGQSALSSAAVLAAGDVDEAEADFNRMCIGPYRLTVPPYESVWRSPNRALNDCHTAAVAYSYAELGLTVGRNLNEPADFIAYELEFLFCAASLSAEAADKGEAEPAQVYAEIAERFWAEHLGHWAESFLSAMAKDSRHKFWTAWAQTLLAQLNEFNAEIELSKFMTGLQTSVVVPPESHTEKRI